MKTIKEMNLEELKEAKMIIDTILSSDISETAKDYYNSQRDKFDSEIENRVKAVDVSQEASKEDEQADPFCESEQDEDCSVKVEESNNMDSLCCNLRSIRARKVINTLTCQED